MRSGPGAMAPQSRRVARRRPSRGGRALFRIELDRQAGAGLAHALQADQPAVVRAPAAGLGHLERDAQRLVGEEEQAGARDVVALSAERAGLEAHGDGRLDRAPLRPSLVGRLDAVAVLHLDPLAGCPGLLRPDAPGT